MRQETVTGVEFRIILCELVDINLINYTLRYVPNGLYTKK